MTDPGRIEEECEDAVFAVCDARERFPTKCANKIERCVKLESNICRIPIEPRPATKFDSPSITQEQIEFMKKLSVQGQESAISTEECNKKMTLLLRKVEDLKTVAAQIEREKYEEMNRLLRK